MYKPNVGIAVNVETLLSLTLSCTWRESKHKYIFTGMQCAVLLTFGGLREDVMGLFDNGMKVGIGLAVGLGTVILAPVVIPALAGVAKPLAKEIIKGGLVAFDKGKVLVAEAKETLEDLAAEAQAEMAMEREEASSVGGTEGTEIQTT